MIAEGLEDVTSWIKNGIHAWWNESREWRGRMKSYWFWAWMKEDTQFNQVPAIPPPHSRPESRCRASAVTKRQDPCPQGMFIPVGILKTWRGRRSIRAKYRCYSLSRVWLFATLWTVAHQAPLSMELSRKEYWSVLPFPIPGDLPYPGMEPASLMFPALVGQLFTSSPTWEDL